MNTKDESIQDLMSVVNSAEIGLVILDKHYTIRVWNLFLVNHSGLSAELVIGANLFEQFPAIDKQLFTYKTVQCISQKKKVLSTWEERPYLFEFKNVRSKVKAVDFMYQNITYIPLVSANGEVDNFAITINDVTDIAASTRQLEAVRNEYSQNKNSSD